MKKIFSLNRFPGTPVLSLVLFVIFIFGIFGYSFVASASEITGLRSPSHTENLADSNTSLSLTWDIIEGVMGYSFLLDEIPDTEPDIQAEADDAASNNITLNGLSDSDSYYFHIRSIGTDGTAGATSHLGPFVVDTTSPVNPIDFTSTAGEGYAALSWTTPPDPDYAGMMVLYRTDSVYPSDHSNGTLLFDDATHGRDTPGSYPHVNIENATVYYYTAFAYDNAGNFSKGVYTTTESIDSPILTINDFFPQTGRNDTAVTITIQGTGFADGVSVKVDNTSCEEVNLVNSTIITATVPQGIVSGAYEVTVTNPDNRSVSSQSLFSVTNPPGIFITPVNGNTSESGDTAAFSVRLDSEPKYQVSMEIVSSDPGEGTVLPAALTFTPDNWNTKQEIVITGMDDIEIDGDQTYKIMVRAVTSDDPDYSELDQEEISVINTDNNTENMSLVPELVYPKDKETGLGTTVEFQWNKVEGQEGELQYHLYYCDNPEFSGCAAQKNVFAKMLYLAGIGASGSGLFLAGIVFAGGINEKKYLQIIVALVLTGTLLVACGSGSGDRGGGSNSGGGAAQVINPGGDMAFSVSDLNPGMTYYWKVVCTDENNGVGSSEVRSYITE